jgi:hypothetical protein
MSEKFWRRVGKKEIISKDTQKTGVRRYKMHAKNVQNASKKLGENGGKEQEEMR